MDVIKFIPFSFFIVVPMAELLLPPYLMVFPNSIPSQFLSSEAKNKKFMEIKEKREIAAKLLIATLSNYFF